MAKKRHRRRVSRVPGAVPGTLAAVAGAREARVRTMVYDESSLREDDGVEAAVESHGSSGVVWVDVVGLGSVEVVRAIGKRFGLHHLALEDAMSPHQRAKVEEYPDSLFIVSRVAREHEGALDLEQISMFVGTGFVITFQEREGDAYDPVRVRLRESRGRIRKQGASYLAYALLDATVDAMFPLLESYDHRLEALEGEVFRAPNPALAESIHDVDHDLTSIRRAVLPMREALSRLVRDEHTLVDEDVRIYLRDCQDHLTQMVDLLEGQRDLAGALVQAHLSALGHRTNEVMKVLTIIATIFIPLGFVAGLYGMNFDREASALNMPELGWEYGYPAILLVMLAIALGLLAYFRRRGWL